MKKYLIIYTILLLSLIVKGQQAEYYFKFIEPDKHKINTQITQIISIDNILADTVFAYANSDELNRFLKFGYKIELLKHPSSGAKVLNMATTIDQMVNWDRYPTYEVYRAMMKKFEQDYPSLCKLDSICTTPNGHQLYVVKLSDNVSVNEQEPQVFFTSTMHGDEATGYILMLRLIDFMLKNYTANTRIGNIINNVELFINPNSNPDGTYRSGNATVSGATRYNANNVDLNRNFPDPIKGDHPDGYSWQPENIGMMSFAASHHFSLAANFHGGIEVANYPWDGWTSSQKLHADNNWYRYISRIYADSAQTNSPVGYFNDLENGITNGGDWYVVYGGRQDYMNWWHKCREITLEISTTKLLSSDALPAYWNYNKASLISYIESALYGISGTVKNSSGEPVRAKIFVFKHDADSSHIYSTSNNGFYKRLIEPGKWDLLYEAPGYCPQIHTLELTGWDSAIENDIILEGLSNVTLSGRVTNSESGNPVEAVKVEVLNSELLSAATGQNGDYSFSSLGKGDYFMRLSKAGYQSKVIIVNALQTSNVFDISLSPAKYEGFEAEVPPQFISVNGLWIKDEKERYEGEYSLRSPSIGNSSFTSLSISLNIAQATDIKFARKVSSENGYDFLYFFIDNVEKAKWSGEQNWAVQTFPVSEGNHTFLWKYQKDGSTISGKDCAWVDSIVFPASTQNVTFNVTYNSSPLEGASITFNDQTLLTGSNGSAIFQNVTRAVDKSFSVLKSTLDPSNGIIDVGYTDLIKPVTLTGTLTYTVTFAVKHNGTALENANVTFNQSEKITSADGLAVFENTPYGQNYSYTVSLNGFQTYSGQINVTSDTNIPVNLIPLGIPENQLISKLEAWPNPFYNIINISFTLRKPSPVEISIFSADGRKVITLTKGEYFTKGYSILWDGKTDSGTRVPAGIYFIRLQSESDSKILKIQIVP